MCQWYCFQTNQLLHPQNPLHKNMVLAHVVETTRSNANMKATLLSVKHASQLKYRVFAQGQQGRKSLELI